MPLTRRPAPKTEALSPTMAKVLLDGPPAHGLTYHDLPPHDELRRLWGIHGPALLRRKRRPWFLERDMFVRAVRGEP